MNNDLSFDLPSTEENHHGNLFVAEEPAEFGGEIPDFVHLHVHSQYSMLDGATRIDTLRDKKTKAVLAMGLVLKAKEDGMRAVALTDHGNMFGSKLFYDSCRAEKIKPIIGCEVYVARENHKLRNMRSGDHLILLAKNLAGYRNLVRMVSIGHTEGFYYRPRIDKEVLEKYSEGIIVSSACIAGEIPRAILEGRLDDAENAARWYKKVFGDDYYFEVQRHPNSGEHSTEETRSVYIREMKAAEEIYKLSEKLGIKTIATNDVHFLNKEDADAHEILLCLNSGKKLSDEKRLRYTRQEWFKTKQEMARLFHDRPDLLTNTLEIADKVEEYELNSDPIMPFFPIPAEFGSEKEYAKHFSREDAVAVWGEEKVKKLGYEKAVRIKFESDYLTHLTMEGAKKRWSAGIPPEILERINFELKTILTMGFPGYFLIVQDFIAAARRLGVLVGPGRGSAAGCVVAYCLGITGIDPTKYDLLFERFLNPDRISMPDIDIDFDDAGRQKVLEWVTEKYGQDHVAHIATFGIMAPKSAIKNVARVLDLPLSESSMLANCVPDTPKITMEKALAESPELAEKFKSPNPLIVKTMEFARELDGTISQYGVHACGILISRDPLTETIPVMPTEGESLLTTQYDGHFVEPIGLIKMDFLGLRTLTILKSTIDNVKRRRGITIDLDKIPLDDGETFKLFSRGETTALFQFESPGMKKHLMALKPNRFEDLVAMNALYRPGPMSYIPQFIKRKHGEEKISYDHPLMETYLKDTYGVTVYQEQVMLQSRALANFTRGESDTLRKAMGKKNAAVMETLKEKFVVGCLANPKFMEADVCGNAPEKAKKLCEKIWGDWEAFAQYAFNKSHSVCYAYVAYQTGWLKTHYPVEFMAAVIDSETKNPAKMLMFIAECERMGIKVLGPDVNSSVIGFSPAPDSNAIRFGFGGVKSLGVRAAEEIIEERMRGGIFKSFIDFMQRMSKIRISVVDSNGVEREQRIVLGRGLQALIITGAFDSCEVFEDRKHLLDSAEAVKNAFSKEEDTRQSWFFDMLGAEEYSFDKDLIDRSSPPMSDMEKLHNEREMLGFYLSGHPFDEFAGLHEALTTFTGKFEDCGLSRYERHNIRLCGMAREVRTRQSKDGRKFLTMMFDTATDTYEILAFDGTAKLKFVTPGTTLENGSVAKCGAVLDDGTVIEEGAVLSIDGEMRFSKKQKDGLSVAEWKFFVTRISSLRNQVSVLLQKVTLVLDSEEPSIAEDFVKTKLMKYIEENSGNTRIAIATSADGYDDGDILAEADLGERFKVSFTAKKFSTLVDDPAVLGYKIEAVAPYKKPARHYDYASR